jgi:ComF family protein
MKANERNSKSLSDVMFDFIALFFPHYCLACSEPLVKGEEMLCTRCILDLPKTNYHFDKTNPIKERLIGRIEVENAIAFLKFNKKGSVQHLLHQLKYNNQPEIGITLGMIYGKELMDAQVLRGYDFLIPVPLHPSKERRRGYNQSTKFAEGLGLLLNIPVEDKLMVRTKATVTQTKKTRVERWENVKSVFELTDTSQIKNKSILLVDDVVTTGATIEALAQKLIDAQCNKISIICLAEAQ